MGTAPPFRHRLRQRHLPWVPETSYVLLGEDRLSKAKWELHWWEPLPPSGTGSAGATFPPGKESFLMSSWGRTA